MEKFDIILDLSNFKHDYHFCSLSKTCPYSELLWSVFSRIQSECGKMRTRITPKVDTFHGVVDTELSFILRRCTIKLFESTKHSWSNFYSMWMQAIPSNIIVHVVFSVKSV